MTKKNIGDGHELDDFYRYKRSGVTVKYINKNGGTTVINNLDTISNELHIDINQLVKFIQKRLGISKIQNCSITGKIDIKILENCVDEFTAEFVLCENPKCRLPERNNDTGLCNACGYQQKKHNKLVETEKDEFIVDNINKKENNNGQTINKDLDIQMSSYMKKLYRERKELKKQYLSSKEIDHILDQCWSCNNVNEWNETLLPLIKKRVGPIFKL